MPEITAPIVDITVYPKQARVIREGTIKLSAGEHKVTLSDLPEKVNSDSVRVSGKGAGVTILGVETRTVKTWEDPPEPERLGELKKLQNRLAQQKRSHASLADELKVIEYRLKHMDTLGQGFNYRISESITKGESAFDDVQPIQDYLEQEMVVLYSRQRKAESRFEEVKTAIQSLQNQINTGPWRKQRKIEKRCTAVDVKVKIEIETDLALLISYFAPDASWRARYDLRLGEGDATMQYTAIIRQSSEEDWTPPQPIKLSTAQLSQRVDLPKIDGWYVDKDDPEKVVPSPEKQRREGEWLYDPPTQSVSSMGINTTLSSFKEKIVEQADKDDVKFAKTQIEAGGYTLEYRTENALEIPSGSRSHETMIDEFVLPIELDYVSIPKSNEQVIWRAKIRNTSPYTLLNGDVALFHDADYLGNTRIDMIAPNEDFILPLRVEDRVKIQRRLINRKNVLLENTDKRQLQYKYTITVTNYLDKVASVTIRDQLPVGLHEAIAIRLEDVSPEPEDVTELNIIKWVIAIEPKQEQLIAFTFVLECPADMDLKGIL